MSSSNQEDRRYLDACKIVEAYEMAVRAERNELSVLLAMESNLDFMDEMLDSSDNALNEMDILDDDPAPDREIEVNLPESQNQETLSESQNSCAEDKPFVDIDGSNIVFNTPPINDIDASVPVADAINTYFGGDGEITAKQIKDAAQECYNCNLKVEFDFQIRPINLLSEILPLINKIGAILDNLLNELKPFDLLANICSLSKNIRLFCLPDLLSILVAIEGLAKRYIGEVIKLTLNWTFLIGPIIKGIVDIAATLMEQIRRLLVAPLDCASGVISSILNFTQSAEESFENMAAFAAAFPKQKYEKDSKVLSRTMKFPSQPELNDVSNLFRNENNKKEAGPGSESKLTYGWEFNANDTLSSAYEKEKERIRKEKRLKKRRKAIDKLNKDPAKRESIIDSANRAITGVGNGEIGYNPTSEELKAIEEEFGRMAEQENQGILKNLLFTINESKEWINSLHANLLLSLKALNGLVANNLEVSFKLGGWILMLFDMVKVIQLVVHFFKNGNFQNMCDIMENDPDKLKDILEKDFKWAAVDIENTRKKIDDWEEKIMLFGQQTELTSCE